MKIKAVVSAIMAMSLTTGGFAFAQGYGNERGERNDRGRNEQAQHNNQQDRRDNAERQQDRRDQNRGYSDQHRGERGAGPNHSYYKGDRMPAEYRHRQYVVDDWRDHHLSAPPRGYQWVQSGGDYVLIAIATGIIAQLLLNN